MRKGISLAALAASLASPAMAQEHHLEEIVVTSHPYRATRETLSQGVSVLAGDALNRNIEGTIGETINSLPGVSSTFFGPGASRPIIRGLGGDRVAVLINGLGAIDASTVSPDHAVAGESLAIESVEVIRGPNTLLYGPSAIGGVVNIIDGRIPRAMPDGGMEGALRGYYGTNADERGGAGSLTLGLGDNFAAHVDGSYKKADDYSVPKGALHHDEEEEEEDHEHEGEEDHEHEEDHAHEDETTVMNSAVEEKTGSVGLSWIGDAGFFGLSLNGTDSRYGVPGHEHHHEDGEEEEHDHDHDHDHEEEEGHAHEEGVAIDLSQVRLDLMGELQREFFLFERTRFRFAYADYEHKEIEDGELATTFNNEGWQGRIELVQKPAGNLTGALGFDIKTRDFDSVGEEAVAPRSKTRQLGVFILEEFDLGAVTLQGGARVDGVNIKAPDIGRNRDFTGISASMGAIWNVSEMLTVTAHASRTVRNPTAEELFSDGPHLATGAYELGNADLTKEIAYGLEGGVRLHGERWSLHGQIYATDYKDFIYLADTGLEEDGLPVRRFVQSDAEFYGFEAEADVILLDGADGDLHLHLQADSVTASLESADSRLPRIPPFSVAAGLDYMSSWFDLGAEVERTMKQDRVAALEEPTPGYTFVNAHLTVRPLADRPELEVGLRLRNLFNETGYNHTSFLKEDAPLPGRDVRFSVGLGF